MLRLPTSTTSELPKMLPSYAKTTDALECTVSVATTNQRLFSPITETEN